MDNLHNVHDIRNQVNLYFDNALGENEKQELLSKVDNDPRCCKIFNKEKHFREFIKNARTHRRSGIRRLIETLRASPIC